VCGARGRGVKLGAVVAVSDGRGEVARSASNNIVGMCAEGKQAGWASWARSVVA
jgi:hypothetical protein